MTSDPKNGRLASWKEISAYLGYDIRTCYRWEKSLGLPVHRLGGPQKSRVFAYKDELDLWMRKGGSRDSRDAQVAAPSMAPGWKRKAIFFAAGFLGLTGFILTVKRLSAYPPSPVDFHIEDSQFVALDRRGRELWRVDTRLPNLCDQAEYRDHFQINRRTPDNIRIFPQLLIKDLDGDGRSEVLLSIQTQDETAEGILECYGATGTKLWSFEAGLERRYGNRVYSRDYRIKGLDLRDINKDGRTEVIVLSYHKPDFPCQLVILDAAGKKLGEYWNTGYFNDFSYLDIDEDGVEEILAVGINNEYGKGCLAVFAVDRIAGGSPQRSAEYISPDIAPGTELAYLLFPRTDVDLAEVPVESIMTIDVLRNKHYNLTALISRIYFELKPDLAIVQVHSSHDFQKRHAEAVREGRVRSRLDPDYFERLRRGALYWNGTAWVSERTANLRNYPED